MSGNPILNNPYDEPKYSYGSSLDGSLNYDEVLKGRRVFNTDGLIMPTKQKDQRDLGFANEPDADLERHIVNLCRKEIGKWRSDNYPNTTRVTKELLNFWFANPERFSQKKLFFAQQEAVETAIWLNEVAEKSNIGQHILNLLRIGQQSVGTEKENQLPRIAFKMATGSGKTVVMACLILYHFFNRQEYRSDTRFADYFLIVAPGITIKSRLGVLFVDTKNKIPDKIEDYYRVRGLVPNNYADKLENLNARLVITNYHNFEPKTLKGNKRSPFDGKVDVDGKKVDTGNREDYSLLFKRLLSKFKKDSRLLVLNDEAHHCYLPKSKGKTEDNEEVDENKNAAVWFSGLREVCKRFKVQNIYDLSATPYYLKGSGYDPYSLFPWVVSDFGLIEAIESGLVKIPFLPESDNTQELEMPVLRNLYEHVKDQLPRKGQRTQRRDANAEGETLSEQPPKLPTLIKQALDMFYNHYVEYFNGQRNRLERNRDLFSAPPVFIVVCNNTSVSKEVYKFIAGYDFNDGNGETQVVTGVKLLFSNYDEVTKRPLKRPPTLLIDSDALENGDQINDDFKKIFASEIVEFKRDFARMHGQGSIDKLTDAEILREVVNTVGQQGKLGSHIRCVVSVSMLTEGWDANTVTHIMGIRKFGSQLLCEQVAGRALRRVSYVLQGYDKEGNPTDDKRKIVVEKFPPEYAHIIGVPFKMFKGGANPPPPDPKPINHIKALKEREKELEITFPNIIGYRIENGDNKLTHDFSGLESYDIDGSRFPTETDLESPISPRREKLFVKDILDKRENELYFLLTKELIKYHFSDEDGNANFGKFAALKDIVSDWYQTKVRLLNIRGDQFKKLLYFHEPKVMVDHIARGINTHLNTVEHIRPVFNHYNRFGSTKYVAGNTTKAIYETNRSHVNFVVEDSGWEGIAAKSLEELPEVLSYVKNNFLEFKIPYLKDGKEHFYYPDFIVRYKSKNGTTKNLIIEISGMSKDKAEKKWYVENRWLPAVNSVREKFDFDEWQFIEIADEIRDIKNELIDKFLTAK
jgi:type III restriction enzyme